LSKFLLEEMNVIICNYQWIFNPFIRETFLKFIGRELQNCILVIDECHNIIDVATDVNSDRITPYSLKLCLKDLEMYQAPILMQSFVNILKEGIEVRDSQKLSKNIDNVVSFLKMKNFKVISFINLLVFIIFNILPNFSINIIVSNDVFIAYKPYEKKLRIS
ncbi:unnamed protein product, partial [marine sediment metagenome]